MKTNNHLNVKSASAALLVGFALFLSACSSESKPEAETDSVASNSLESSIKVLDTKPADALAVKAARETLKPGDAAVVFGQVGGVDEPFLEGYAGFVLGDTDIQFCDEMGDDHCKTPWDACCEDTDKLKVSRASVQFVDAEGQLLSQGMKGFAGIKELDEVVVIGAVAEASTPDNLIINATRIYVSN